VDSTQLRIDAKSTDLVALKTEAAGSMGMWSKIQAWLQGSGATPETSAFGLLSGAPAELEKTKFFRWFNLKPVQERRDDGGVAYAPAAENFRHRIALIFFRTPMGATRSIALQVDRSLLGERQFEASARDLMKSFLLAPVSCPSRQGPAPSWL
jgi:hypothetical protein